MKDISPSLKEFCKNQDLMRLAYTDSRGYPRVVPVWFIIIDDDYYFGTDASSAKWKAIQRDDRVGWVIDGGQRDSYKGVSMCGRAEEIEDDDLRNEVYEALGNKYFGSTEHAEFVKIFGEIDDEGTVYVRLTVEDSISWEY